VAGEDEVAEEQDETDSDEDEQIIVMREEEQLDPEAEAEFDKEFERMMSESLDSRKFEKKTHFDVPLPMRKIQRMPAAEPLDEEVDSGAETPPNTMAFSLMTRKGNRPQVIPHLLPLHIFGHLAFVKFVV
jgi:regulator of nonsense transcripts 2